ncbi:tyrosinase family protein [Glaciimonas immobilis]|uniref:Tyrosinase n=1 Tax=Glaciimonas immobilis TaxID=728004 RepID=A0A840S208_9BURK|nr:tyrosinase family protein [Glaciimonas immobilis]KAF3995892.1 tyrosinase family protein [Glaciimonas immobilis]MBB5202589.1 tyrosinase [Glaciimonas immobilis]
MTNYMRTNAWNDGGTFNNADLLWYAKGVGKMMGRSLNDPASWWFFAAIHGELVNPDTAEYQAAPAFIRWGSINNPPSVPTTPLPVQATQDKFWNQCQHGSWYFLPWHRGYLLALEAQLRADIVSLGGPNTWALPYWDYFGGSQPAEALMPPAFGATTLLDGTPNPLYVAMRYGPDNNGNIYIPTEAWEGTHNQDLNWQQFGDVTDTCLQNDIYTGSDTATPLPGFGGPESGFSHGGSAHGNIEQNPHDLVHVYVGGYINSTDFGLMADPDTAALDPIFYLHHCNIDRMWAVWNGAGNTNPTDLNWLNGPTPQFVMPMPNNEPWVYTPGDVQNLSSLDYTYQDVTAPLKPAVSLLAHRLFALGAISAADVVKSLPSKVTQRKPAELFGANAGPVQVSNTGGTPIEVTLHPDVQKRVVGSFQQASISTPPDQLYLKLENVRGTQDATVLRVYIDLPVHADRDTLRAHYAGSVGLFGLRSASVKNGAHGGAGLTFVLDISRFVDKLHVKNKLSSGRIKVNLVRSNELPQSTDIEVGRVSIYRQPY